MSKNYDNVHCIIISGMPVSGNSLNAMELATLTIDQNGQHPLYAYSGILVRTICKKAGYGEDIEEFAKSSIKPYVDMVLDQVVVKFLNEEISRSGSAIIYDTKAGTCFTQKGIALSGRYDLPRLENTFSIFLASNKKALTERSLIDGRYNSDSELVWGRFLQDWRNFEKLYGLNIATMAPFKRPLIFDQVIRVGGLNLTTVQNRIIARLALRGLKPVDDYNELLAEAQIQVGPNWENGRILKAKLKQTLEDNGQILDLAVMADEILEKANDLQKKVK